MADRKIALLWSRSFGGRALDLDFAALASQVQATSSDITPEFAPMS